MPNLGVLCSDKAGLETWRRVGSLSREVALPKKFVEAGWYVSFFTYDQHRNLPDPGLKATIYPQWPVVLPKKLQALYYRILPLRYKHPGRNIDILMTNQAHGATPAVKAASAWETKLVARCGYVYGECAEKLGKTGEKTQDRITREKSTFRNADKCVVPTVELKDWVVEHYGIGEEKIEVIPNYVDTAQFKPMPTVDKEFDVICIGRLVEDKRHDLLIRALANTGAKVLIVGHGKLEHMLKELATTHNVELTMIQRVKHAQLPEYLNRAKIYVNLSKWEGHPKAMIEAMACGLPVVGANSPGIKNLVQHDYTGLLVEPNEENVAEAIEHLRKNAQYRSELGTNSQEVASRCFSLENIFEQYLDLFAKLGISTDSVH